MIFQGASPFYLMREIATGNDAESLAGVASKILLLVRRLLEEGAKAENIIKMISMLNDALSERLFRISVKTLGVKDYPFALIYFGNQGRREPTFGFHMQAYLLFDESPDIVRKHKIHRYFELCSHYIENTPLFRIHSPVSNSSAGTKIICRSLSSWREFVSGMLTVRSSKDAVNFGMMFDVRPGFGDGEIIENALSSTLNALSKHPSFLFHLAGNFIRNYPPVSFYRGSIVERDSLSKSRFNIKTRGLDLFVNFARITALRYGIEETNTYYRLRMLWENGRISGEFYSDMREAYEFQNQLLLVHQLNQIENGKQPDCTIDPAMLTYLERRILKEAFSVMNRMGSFVKEEFRFLI
jgi:CBS domain-containing protein